MRDFLKQHRQKFLTEDYYLKRKQLYQDTLHDYLNNSQFYTSEFQTYDYFKVHKQPEWDVIAGYYLKFLYLEYTAGQDIASLKKYLYQFIEYKEKECQAIVDYANTEQRPALLVDLYDTDSIFNVIGLAYLLDCRDLLARIEPMLQGTLNDWDIDMTDAMTDRLFAFNNPDQLVYDADDDECYHDLNRKIICQCIDNINQSESREKILDALDVNLRQWYTKREGYSWYNSHLHMDTNFAYFGYWDFEAAALVYLLDLDDTILHKYLYYPKDMVAWAKANYPNQLSG